MSETVKGSQLFIVDNSDADWKVRSYLSDWCSLSSAIDIATGYFEIGALLALESKWQAVDRIRILMGDEVSLRTKHAFVEGLRKITAVLDESLEAEKSQNDFLQGVPAVVEGIRSGKIQCKVYRKDKFHAKAYLTHGRAAVVGSFGLVGSSNFTFPGLVDNIELNVQIRGPEVALLQEWYERYWAEAEDVTPDILRTLERHVRDHTPFEVYAKALHQLFTRHELTSNEWEQKHSTLHPILDQYQRDGYRSLIGIARQHGGALLCDGVGLGKTFVGLMLIERLVMYDKKRVVLLVPKSGRESVFADMFAQTVTYGLFSVAARRTFPGIGTAVTKENVSDLVFTSPFLKDMLGVFLGIRSYKGKIDFDELGVSDVTDLLTSEDTDMEAVLRDFNNKTRGEDPVIHFYEHFLSAYNKQLKIQRGVFYTPQPVVSYIVRSVHELLQTEFGLADGLADTTTWGEMVKKQPGLTLPPLTDELGEKRTISPDEPFVQILDPATGTATFLVEVIDVIHRTLAAKWKKLGWSEAKQQTAWNDYVPKHLLPRLHAFELMMAPYAIAHMKLGLKLAETGYRFGIEERARIYLTNALEPKVKQLPQIGFDALAHEAAAVNEIKWYKRFTVVIGNPPYSGNSSNRGEWIENFINDYRKVDGKPLGEVKVWLKDDYVKFTRFSEQLLESTRVGILGFITNNSFFDGLTFRGMRHHLLSHASCGYFMNLHGKLPSPTAASILKTNCR